MVSYLKLCDQTYFPFASNLNLFVIFVFGEIQSAMHSSFERNGKYTEQYKKRKEEKEISLVESDFEKQWNDGKAAEDKEKEKEEESGPGRRPVVKRDFYFNEAMNVTIDYLKALAEGTASLPRAA